MWGLKDQKPGPLAVMKPSIMLPLALLAGMTVSATAACSEKQVASVEDSSTQLTDPHAGHRAMIEESRRYQRSKVAYEVPDIRLVGMDGSEVDLRKELAGNDPVILSFIFTSCTTICPLLTATLAQAQDKLLQQPVVPRIVSVSIDPEHDTPQRLREYAESYQANPDWLFVTGKKQAIVEVQRAFDAYRGDKLNHIPLTFLYSASEDLWVRLDGFTTAADLVSEYQSIIEP